MVGRKGIAEPVRVHCDRHVPPNRRSAALKLVHGEIHAVAKKGAESPLHAILAHQPFQVPVLAAGEIQQCPVRAPGVLVDGPSGNRKEVSQAPLKTVAQGRSGLLQTEPVSEEGGKTPEKAGADCNIR